MVNKIDIIFKKKINLNVKKKINKISKNVLQICKLQKPISKPRYIT